ncbi:hypothetical protein F2P56_010095 [Juglans regia]|uniref:Late embryogenesis abundant protein LEA-2 subgroup domain-containing protein n=2 Tax=Juglans regia TaxID=51240 RepID=A0A833XZ54_JUGRE|nr:uncharacterized protein LOC108999717 [Juglans regia]KAF5473487.1 hypothetical protein F2P56_010095 [Juglans regia]
MASTPEDQPKKDPGQSSEENQDNPPAASSDKPPQPTKYPPAMGYPYLNIHGQPAYPPQPGYPPNANNAAYPYDLQPPPAECYRTSNSCTGFFRGCLAALFVFVFLSFLSNLVSWFLVHPEIPVFYVDKFSVSSFNVSDDVAHVTGIWEADITVQNPNHKLKIYSNRIDNYVFYEDEVLTSSSLGRRMFLDTKAQDSFHVTLSRNNTLDENMLPKSIENAIEQEYKDNGWVSFSFRMLAWTTLEYGSWWRSLKTMEVLCDNLKVGFVGATGNVKFLADQPRRCAVYV